VCFEAIVARFWGGGRGGRGQLRVGGWGEKKRQDKYLAVWLLFGQYCSAAGFAINDRRVYLQHTAVRGKCVELARCVESDLGVSNLRCVELPHLVHPHGFVVTERIAFGVVLLQAGAGSGQCGWSRSDAPAKEEGATGTTEGCVRAGELGTT
jgi:hypothetical protein